MEQSSFEKKLRIRKQFDSFCKTLLKNEMIDYERARSYRLKYEISFSELTQEELNRMSTMDEYIVESEIFHVLDYDVEVKDFVLPALSVQPLVENAIKHGLMRLESGGTVVIRTYETSAHFCVAVKDDGVGFDVDQPIDEKKHVGLRNIRGRLKAMVNGELTLESQPGVGTTAVIMIPKEVMR